jgi:acetolactate synthase-1/2/3 large subunit
LRPAIKRLEPKHRSRADYVKAAHADYLGFAEPTRSPGDVQLSQIVRGLSDRLPHDTIICNGAGNYAVWVHRFWRYRQYRTELAPTSGSMGYGLPAAVAAKLQHPERTVIAFAGDGCFQMTGLEFMTAVENRLPLIVIVCNNGMYGTIRMHQERTYPWPCLRHRSRQSPTSRRLRAPAAASARRSSAPKTSRALSTTPWQADFPAIIELSISPEALTPVSSLSETRAKALAAQG